MNLRMLFSLVVLLLVAPVSAEDWLNWRGPRMDGTSSETGLPDSWTLEGENLLWRQEAYATRSSPVVMNGKVFVVCRAFPETTQEGEKVVCLDAATGELEWESIHNVFLSDAPAERVGWSSVVCDPASNNVYLLGLGCTFQCLDAATGKVKWEHSMSEEYGMLSTYGGRTNFPMVFEDLVIISGVTTGWGTTAVPAHRFFAFNKLNGEAVWISSTRPRPEDTTYSTPVFTKFNGEDAMVVGAGDGALYAFRPRNGSVIWKYQASNRGINTTPMVDSKGIVYCGHSEQNAADTTVLGAVFALNGNTKGDIQEKDLLWKIDEVTVGRSAPVKLGDRVYFVDDGGALIIVQAADGTLIDEKKIGRAMFGSSVVADNKLYVFENTGRGYIFKPTDEGVETLSQVRLAQGEEVFGSPAVSNGRIYIPSTGALYCIGNADAAKTGEKKTANAQQNAASKQKAAVTQSKKPAAAKDKPATVNKDAVKKDAVAKDAPAAAKDIAMFLLTPAEAMILPGSKTQMQLTAFNAKGEAIGSVTDAKFKIEGGGKIDAKGVYTASEDAAESGVVITASRGEMTATARFRVVPPLPWKFDFSNNKVPATWIGADYRHKPAMAGEESALVKVSTIPKGTRSQSWMGWTDLHDYTVQADFLAPEQGGSLPDMGLINQRYTLDLQGAQQQLQIRSWTPRLELRFAKTVEKEWKADVWYRMKFQSENAGGKAILRGKVWPRDESEPAEWQIEAADATPNTHGSPGLFGNATDAQFYIDNVMVTPN